MNATILCSPHVAGPLRLRGLSAAMTRDNGFRDFFVDGNKASQSTSPLIRIRCCDRCTFRNIIALNGRGDNWLINNFQCSSTPASRFLDGNASRSKIRLPWRSVMASTTTSAGAWRHVIRAPPASSQITGVLRRSCAGIILSRTMLANFDSECRQLHRRPESHQCVCGAASGLADRLYHGDCGNHLTDNFFDNANMPSLRWRRDQSASADDPIGVRTAENV